MGVHAGNLVRYVAEITGGKGGGKPDMAMAGGKEADKINTALESVKSAVEKMIKKG